MLVLKVVVPRPTTKLPVSECPGTRPSALKPFLKVPSGVLRLEATTSVPLVVSEPEMAVTVRSRCTTVSVGWK